MKIKSKSHHGKKMSLPHLNEVAIPADGILEVENEEHAKFLVEKCGDQFSFVDLDDEEKEGPEEGKEKDELDGLSVADLIEIAKSSSLKGWQALVKKPELLRKFLRKKLAESGEKG